MADTKDLPAYTEEFKTLTDGAFLGYEQVEHGYIVTESDSRMSGDRGQRYVATDHADLAEVLQERANAIVRMLLTHAAGDR